MHWWSFYFFTDKTIATVRYLIILYSLRILYVSLCTSHPFLATSCWDRQIVAVMATIPTTDCSVNGNTPTEKEDIMLLDDLLRLRAADKTQVPLLCLPKSEQDIVDYEEFTGKDIDRFVDQAAKYYMRCGLQPVSELLWPTLL